MTIDRFGTARERAVVAVVESLRSGEGVLAARAAARLADAVVMTTAKGRFEGSAAVIERLSGQWPITPVLAGGVWEIGPGGESQVEARATFPGIGAAPRAYRLSFEFDQQDRVTAITEHVEPFLASSPAATMPPVIRRRIDRAMADGIPITMGYIDEAGDPVLSLRGSLRALDGTTLCLWIRNADGGLVRAIGAGRSLSFLYRDSASRTTLVGKGRGEIVKDVVLRDAIYDGMSEGDQRHDPKRSGTAALIHVESIRGTSPEGPVAILPPRDA